MKFLRVIFVFILCIQVGYAQVGDVGLVGKLDNGLSYYIKRNPLHKEKASIRLVVKVGSIYESEEERGLAHFLEHLVFRGSENFADWEIIEYLESIGAQLGPDTNAFTTFEQTAYLLQVPMEKLENLDRALLILSDFAGRASLRNDLIEIERRVVLEECHCSENQSGMKIWRETFLELFENSAYKNRLPIGAKEVILHCDPQLIRNFYKKWYRPNRMAVIAVGDFEETKVKDMIEKYFGEFQPGDETIISTKVLFPEDPRALFIQEEEESFVQGAFLGFYEADCLTEITDAHIKRALVSSLAVALLNQRLEGESKKYPAPYLYGKVFPQTFTTFHQALRIHFVGFMDRPVDGLRAICREVERFKQFGPTQGEMERIASQAREEIRDELANLDRIPNDSIVKNYHNHFLCEACFRSRESELEFRKKIIEEITSLEIQLWVRENLLLDRMYTVFSMPKEVITISDLEAVLDSLKREVLEPLAEEERSILRVDPSQVVEVEASSEKSESGSTTLVLENGIKVILHPTNFEKGRILIDLVARGGRTLCEVHEYASQEVASEYLIKSGLANLSGLQLEKFLNSRSCSLGVEIGPHSRLIQAIGPVEESEILFQLIRSVFLHRRSDLLTWESIIEAKKEIDTYKNNQPTTAFIELANKVIYEGHPFYQTSNPLDANEETAITVLNRVFGNPKEFSVVVVGDFEVSAIKNLIFKYFSFSEIEERGAREMDMPFLNEVSTPKTELIYKGKETHALTLVAYRKNCSNVSVPLLKALTHILSERCLKKMRCEMGQSYSPSFIYELPLAPLNTIVCLAACFSSDAEKSDSLKEVVIKVIEEFLTKGVSDNEVNSAKEILKQQVKEGKIENRFLVNLHTEALLGDKSLNEVELETVELNSITKENLQKIGSEIFAENPEIRISLFPCGS